MSRVTKGDREERCVTNCSVEQEKKRMVDRGMIEKESERKRERAISLRFPIRKREIDPRILIGERAIYFPSVYFTLFENRRILQTFPCLRFVRNEFRRTVGLFTEKTFANKFLVRPQDEKRSLLPLLERGTKQQKRASLKLTSQQQVAPFETDSRTTRTRFSRNKHKLVNNEDARTLTRKYLPLSGIHLHFMRETRRRRRRRRRDARNS